MTNRERASARARERGMESLEKLEMVQKMLLFMESSGLSSSHHDSDRFLAHFLLFMIQPCGALNMENRRCLISENLPKISASVFEKALAWINGEDSQQSCVDFLQQPHPHRSDPDDKSCLNPLGTSKGYMAMIGLNAMQQANSTLEDFCRSYFMFHGMDICDPHLAFKFLPVLSFTESYIYQMDRLNEEMSPLPVDFHAQERGNQTFPHCCQEHKLWVSNNFLDAFNSDPFKCLVLQLEHLGLLTERIRRELRCGTEYWALERKLCHALINKKEILVEEVMRAIHLKSFDYRVLNILLYQLREQQDDIVENNFNILRMFVGIYGASMAPKMLAKSITEAEDEYQHLLDALDPELSSKYKRRCQEAAKEGGQTSTHPLGKWTIPPVIADEDFYRSQLLSSKSTAKPT